MNARFQNWWRARGAVARNLIKFTLSIVAIIGILLFMGFNMHGEGSTKLGLKTRITVGQPGPWLVWEKINSPGITTNADGSSTTISMTAESHVNILSSSFIAGMLAIYSMQLLFRIGRIEKQTAKDKIQ